MALGKAFIEVHADTKPFARELESELKKILSSMSTTSMDKSGQKMGHTLGDGISKGVDSKKGDIGKSLRNAVNNATENKSFLSRFAGGIIDTIDDGLSGLPAEFKAAFGAVLVAITPLIAAGLSGLIAGALAAGVSGLGVLLAFQFERVRTAGSELWSFLRTLFTTLGEVFVEPVLLAFRTIEERFGAMGPQLSHIFGRAAEFIEPLTEGLVGFFENLLPGLSQSLDNASGLVDTLAFHFKVLGRVIGDSLMVMTGSDDAEQGLADILTVVETLIVSFAALVRVLTEIYGALRAIGPYLTPFVALTGIFGANGAQADKASESVGGFTSSMQEAIAPTKAEEEALKEINDQINAFTEATGNAWQSNINFEKSLDDMSESLRSHRGELDLNTRAGQDHQQSILNASQALIKQRNDTIALTGDTEKANATFATNRKRLEDAAVAAGISRTKFRELTDAILTVPPPISPGVTPSATQSVQDATSKWYGLGNAIGAAINAAKRASGMNFGVSTGGLGKGVAAHANGGVFSTPHMGLVAESGPEAIIPLSNPARAAQVMNQAGLSGAGNVNVYIGNSQLDAYIDQRVNRQMSMTARTMSYGSRAV